jgi:hypothetical protein
MLFCCSQHEPSIQNDKQEIGRKALFPSTEEAEKIPHSKAKPAAKFGSLAFASEKALSVKTSNMKKYKDALQHSFTKIEVFHLVLTEDSPFDVWGLSLKDNDKFYWSWKPYVLERAFEAERTNRIFEGETLDSMFFHMRAATVREVPCGPNISHGFVAKNSIKYDYQVLAGLLPRNLSESDVRDLAFKFCENFKNNDVKEAYSTAMESVTNSDKLKRDVAVAGKGSLWAKLASGSNNIVYQKLSSLNEVLLDEKIEEIFRFLYNFEASQAPSSWPVEKRVLAFGRSRENGTVVTGQFE